MKQIISEEEGLTEARNRDQYNIKKTHSKTIEKGQTTDTLQEAMKTLLIT